jgi:hypothetical protein
MEMASAGDDIVVETLSGARIDVQAKYHARLDDDGRDALIRLMRGLADPSIRAVLLVDNTSARTITKDLRGDLEKLATGRRERLSEPTRRMLKVFAAAGVNATDAAFSRLHIAVLDLESNGEGEELGFTALRKAIEDESDASDAWERLVKLGLDRTAQGSGNTVATLIDFLGPKIPVRRQGTSAAATVHHYRSWRRDISGSFPVIGFRSVRLSSQNAWDHLVEIGDGSAAPTTLAEELRQYHDPQRDNSGKGDIHVRTDDFLVMRDDAVIVGAAGSGKSTLLKRIASEAIEDGHVPFVVRLKTLAAIENKTLEEALLDVVFEGSGLDAGSRRFVRPTMLIADGVDECGSRRQEIAEFLVKWRRGHPSLKLIVATRSFGYARADFPTFLHVQLEPLWPHAVFELSEAIFTAAHGDSKKGYEDALLFGAALETNNTAAVAARTPLLLACLTGLFAQGRPLPDRRASLFRDILEVLRDQAVPMSSRDDVSAAVADRVAEIAGWRLVDEPTLSVTGLRTAIGDQLFRDALATSARAGAVIAESAIKFWEAHRLVERLTTGTTEIVTFVHNSLAEYAAARFVVGLGRSAVAEWVRRVHGDSRWHQTLLLAAGTDTDTTVIETLLSIDRADGAGPRAALLAADAIHETDALPQTLIDDVVESLFEYLEGDTSSAVAGANRLIGLYRFAPTLIAERSEPLRRDERSVVRLAAEAVTFANRREVLEPSMPISWLEGFLPVVRLRFGKQPLPPHNDKIPTEAYDLYERAAVLALDALFRTAPADDALSIAVTFLKRVRSLDLLSAAEDVMVRYGHHAEFLKVTEWTREFVPLTEKFRPPLLKILEAIAAVVGDADGPILLTRGRYLGRVLTAIGYWDLEGDDLVNLAHHRHDLLSFAIDRAIRAVSARWDELRHEVAVALGIATDANRSPVEMHSFARRVRVDPAWKRAVEPFEFSTIRLLLLDHSTLMNWVGVNLLEAAHPRAGTDELIRDAVLHARWDPLYWLTQILPEMTGSVTVAASLLVERLTTNPNRSCTGMLRALLLDRVRLMRTPASRTVLEPALQLLTASDDAVVAKYAQEVLDIR